MFMAPTFSSGLRMLLVLSIFLLAGNAASFHFTIHHRFSDSIKGILDSEALPEKHTPGYYATMVHRDRLVRGRRLATDNVPTKVTFAYGNETFFIDSLGFLYYANISVGTPSLDFLVALDTGSDLFWLPCECSSCLTYLNTTNGGKFMLNHYSPNDSSTSAPVPCSNSLCKHSRKCSSKRNTCPFEVSYPSLSTTTTGYLVQDVLHLVTDDSKLDPVRANITFGCGKVHTSIFTENIAAPNGLIGLGMESISVPSFLATQGLTADSFSMCFGNDDVGRIDFGDTGTPGQKETPFNRMANFPSYNVTITKIIVGDKANNVEFTAIFDSMTSFTYLTEPAYSIVSKQMDAGIELKRYTFDPLFPFEYCYELLPNAKGVRCPVLNFTMKGGDDFVPETLFIRLPINNAGRYAACLSIGRSTDIDIIGQNLMSGLRIVFNREKMVLGWSSSDCYENGSGTPSGNNPPSDSPPADSPSSNSHPPSGDSPPANDSSPSGNSPPPSTPGGSTGVPGMRGNASRLSPLTSVFVAALSILVLV